MADKISVEIALEGGKEVEDQLAGIGKAGQQAFGDIQSAAEQLNLDSPTQQFDELGNAGKAAFDKIKASVGSAVGLEQITQAVGKVQGAFDTLGTAAERVATRMTKHLGAIGVVARTLGPMGIAIAAVGGAFVKFGDDAADALTKLTSSGAKLGLTAQQFDALQKVLGRSGISADALSGLEKFKQTMSEDFVPANVISGVQAFINLLQAMPDSVARTQLAISRFGDEFGSQLIAALRTGGISAQEFAAQLQQVTPATQEQINNAEKYKQSIAQLTQAWNELKGAIAPITTPVFQFLTDQVNKFKQDLTTLQLEIARVKAFWDVAWATLTGQDVGAAVRKATEEYRRLETQLTQTGATAAGSMNAASQAVLGTGAAAGQTTQAIMQTGAAAQQAGQQGAQAFDQINQVMLTGVQVIQQYQEALRQLAWYQNLPRPTSVLQGLRPDPIGAMAGGGLLGGRGTGTSDSNLAWVSRGEYITPARAVAQPGVLSFLEALRRSGGNLRNVLDGVSRFALGGLVPRGIPAYAAGGPVGMSHVTIQFPGLPPVSGLRASAGVVDELRKSAALAQVRSGGRKPSRYS